MSKMGQELDRRLDLAKYDLYEALGELLDIVTMVPRETFTKEGQKRVQIAINASEQALAKVEGEENEYM